MVGEPYQFAMLFDASTSSTLSSFAFVSRRCASGNSGFPPLAAL
ncbi:hypothetical protein [Pyxidicoccus trucidator]|nr:hypothetical protein [Pyxidicoccus trucidator]